MRNECPDPLHLIEEVIRTRAFQLYEERGSQPGHDLEDWFQAEAELLTRKPTPAGQPTQSAKAAAA